MRPRTSWASGTPVRALMTGGNTSGTVANSCTSLSEKAPSPPVALMRTKRPWPFRSRVCRARNPAPAGSGWASHSVWYSPPSADTSIR